MRVAVISEAKPAFHLPGEPTLPSLSLSLSLSLSSLPCFLHQREPHVHYNSTREGKKTGTKPPLRMKPIAKDTRRPAKNGFNPISTGGNSIVRRPTESACSPRRASRLRRLLPRKMGSNDVLCTRERGNDGYRVMTRTWTWSLYARTRPISAPFHGWKRATERATTRPLSTISSSDLPASWEDHRTSFFTTDFSMRRQGVGAGNCGRKCVLHSATLKLGVPVGGQ